MVTKFYVVPTYASEVLFWISFIIYSIAAGLTFKARRKYKKADEILKEKTKEMESMLEVIRRDATTLNREIEEVRKLKLL